MFWILSCNSITEDLIITVNDDASIAGLPPDYMYTLSLEEIMDISVSD